MKNVIRTMDTPLGIMQAMATDNGIAGLSFMEKSPVASANVNTDNGAFNRNWVFACHPIFEELDSQIKEYFKGRRKQFTLPLDPIGTDFQLHAWEILKKIHYGETLSYQEQARLMGKPTATQAVGNANRHNPLSILVPCHRVVGKNGKLTGYHGGVERKASLIELEQRFK